MKHLIIVGARGWGREVYASAIGTKAYAEGEYDIKGFLDSKEDALSGLNGVFPKIISSPESYIIQEDDVFFIAMGDPQWRKHYADLMKSKGAQFISIICNGAYINPTASIGEGSYISGLTCISDNVKVGNFVMIHPYCNIGHDAIIGDFASLEAYVFMGGMAKIGIGSILHFKSSILRHKSVGDNVEVGAGSVVMRNIKDGLHVHGNPAKRIDY